MISTFLVTAHTVRSLALDAARDVQERDVSGAPQLSGLETMRQALTAPRSTQRSGTILVHQQGSAKRGYAVFASARMISRQKAGRSSGFRDVIRLPSTTTSESDH